MDFNVQGRAEPGLKYNAIVTAGMEKANTSPAQGVSLISKGDDMEFGRVPETQLQRIDFRLPVDPLSNLSVFGKLRKHQTKVYVGCAKWGRQEWAGKIYPLKAKEKDFLELYGQHYNSIELNATHYKIYGPAAISKWASKVQGRDFLFCPKMYQGITHRGNLKGKGFLTTEFLRGILSFQQHLGPVFLQVSDAFGPKRKEELFTYLRALPSDLAFFLELRHPDWFSNNTLWNEVVQTLASIDVGLVNTDTAGRRDCCHMALSVPRAFIRYVGNSLHPTDYSRIDQWIDRIHQWVQGGLQEIYFFMHMHDETYSPELTVYFIEKLNARCGFDIQKPRFIKELP